MLKAINYIHALFITKTFMSNARVKLANNQAKAKQYSEAELLSFENYSHSSSTLSSNYNRIYFKIKQRNKCVCIQDNIRSIIMNIKCILV